MRILFIAPLPDPVTGQSLACRVLLDELEKHHQVDVVDINKTSLKSGAAGGALGRSLQVLGFAWQAWRRARHADVIYFTISESVAGNLKDLLIYAACAGRLSRMAIHLHGGAGMRVLMHDKPLLAAINRFFLRRLGAIVLLGERHLDILRDLPNRQHVHLVPNFAQDTLFLAPEAIEAKFRHTAPLRLLYLSNLIPGKGYLELLAAYESLSPEQRSELRMDFAGAFENPQDEADFRGRIANLPGVSYHGVVGGANKARLLADAHVFCLPTYYPYEGQPISILEAYASGCSVITTDHSGIFDVFEPGQNGLTVTGRSVPSVAQALAECLANPTALLRHAIHNRRQADERFRVATYNFRLASLLQDLSARITRRD
jgi:glycosyltransferase involved in cell wall biosynthesis